MAANDGANIVPRSSPWQARQPLAAMAERSGGERSGPHPLKAPSKTHPKADKQEIDRNLCMLMTHSLPHERAKILVVDDSRSMRELLRLHLANHGYEVLLAEDAVVAGHLVLRERPDLILLDVEMPYMTGYELAAALKGDDSTRDIPLVFLTADEGVVEHSGRLGAAAYLNKPVMADQLLEVVEFFASKA